MSLITAISPRVLTGPLASRPARPQQLGEVYLPNDGASPAFWSGALWVSGGSALAFFYYLSFTGSAPLTEFLGNGFLSATALRQPIVHAATCSQILANVTVNSLNQDIVLEIYKNGVATGQTLTVPGHSFLGQAIAFVAVPFAAGDQLDVAMTTTATGGSINFSASVMF